MSLPKRVQAALDAATVLEAQETARRDAAPQPVANAAELIQPVVNEPPVAPPVIETPQAPPPAPKEDFEAKFRTLQGMYQADVTRMRKQFDGMASTIEDLQRARQEAPTAPTSPDPKDVEAFGADIIEMVGRYVERQTSEIVGRVTALERAISGVSQQTAVTREEAFYGALDSGLPVWREVNVDPRWLAWLGEVDPVYQVPRQAALDQAFKRMNAHGVIAIFRAFIDSLPKAAAPAESLANQVAPSSVASAAPVAVQPKRSISTKLINDFFRDQAQGKYDTRASEAAEIEAEINAAVAEGRVT